MVEVGECRRRWAIMHIWGIYCGHKGGWSTMKSVDTVGELSACWPRPRHGHWPPWPLPAFLLSSSSGWQDNDNHNFEHTIENCLTFCRFSERLKLMLWNLMISYFLYLYFNKYKSKIQINCVDINCQLGPAARSWRLPFLVPTPREGAAWGGLL